jgi:hypothetical protein
LSSFIREYDLSLSELKLCLASANFEHDNPMGLRRCIAPLDLGGEQSPPRIRQTVWIG